MSGGEEPGKPARTFNEHGSHARLPAELIITASERKPDLTCLFEGQTAKHSFKMTQNGTLGANRFSQMAAAPNIFAAGDLHTGRATVIGAVAGGRLAARSIHHLLTHGTIPLPDNVQHKINPKSILRNVRVPETQARISIDELSVAMRRRSFVEEVIATIGFEQALTEAKRCLQCGTYGYDH